MEHEKDELQKERSQDAHYHVPGGYGATPEERMKAVSPEEREAAVRLYKSRPKHEWDAALDYLAEKGITPAPSPLLDVAKSAVVLCACVHCVGSSTA